MSGIEEALFELIVGLLFILLPQPFYARWLARLHSRWGLLQAREEDIIEIQLRASRFAGAFLIALSLVHFLTSLAEGQ